MQESQEQLNYHAFKHYYKSLDPEQQAGFLLWPSVEGLRLNSNEKKLFESIKPSGVVLFKRNFESTDQAHNLVSELKSLCTYSNAKASFVISVDEEGGRVSRLPLEHKTRPVFEFVQNRDKKGLVQQLIKQIDTAKKIGINCFLAPVLDIYTEPSNTVIGDRSFGTTASEVCEYAKIVFDSLKKEHILPCGKHFPGHGDTKEDSHISAAISLATLSLLEEREWKPFEYFIELGLPMIMAAHVILPNLKAYTLENDIPSTLNQFVLTKILKEQLKFNGLILSDDLRMGAIEQYYENKGVRGSYLSCAAIDALNAGCDILLSCHSITEEVEIITAINEEMTQSTNFFDLCCQKAFKQRTLIQTFFEDQK